MPATVQQLGPRVRGVCIFCGYRKALRKDGRVPKHMRDRVFERGPFGSAKYQRETCPGSNLPPREDR